MNRQTPKIRPTTTYRNDYFNYSASTGGMNGFTNKDLVCHDCVNLIKDNLVSCRAYDVKPDHIYYDKGCEEYKVKPGKDIFDGSCSECEKA